MRLPAIIPLVLLALLAGCGGQKALSHKDFVKQADALCKTTQQQLRKLPPPSDNREAAAYLTREYDIQKKTLDKMRKLKPQKQDQQRVDALLQKFDRVNVIIKAAASALGRNDKQEFQAASDKAKIAVTDAGAAAADFGLQVCGTI
jgi:Tfp pilus assembly protein PilP